MSQKSWRVRKLWRTILCLFGYHHLGKEKRVIRMTPANLAYVVKNRFEVELGPGPEQLTIFLYRCPYCGKETCTA